MPSTGDLTSICIRKKPKQRFNNFEIKSLAARFGIVESIRETPEILFINFNNITNLNSCMDEFRNFGFTVEESKRNKQPQAAEQKQIPNESFNSSAMGAPPIISNFASMKNKTGCCVLCQKNTVLVCQRCTDFYCSVECQLKDWHSHRFICFPIPKLIDVSQLHSDVNHIIPTCNVVLPQMQPQQIAPIPLMQIPINTNFVQTSRYVPPNLRGNQQQPPPPANNSNASKPNDNNVSKNFNNNIAKNSDKINTSKENHVSKSTKNNNKPPSDKNSSPSPDPKQSSKSIVPNNSLTTAEKNHVKENLARLKLLKTKNPSPPVKDESDDDQSVDANVLSFLKSAVEQNKGRRLSSALSRSSSLKSICPNVPTKLKGDASFPANNSICLIVGNDLIRSSLYVRPLTETAGQEYNEIIDLINNQGKQCNPLEKKPKEGDQVLLFKDGIFCRAIVVNADSVDEIDLYVIDTGEQELGVKLSDLKRLPSEFKNLKKYVFSVKLRNCSMAFGEKAQQYINDLISKNEHVRIQYINGIASNLKNQIMNDFVCDFYHNSTNKNINEHLKLLQEQDDNC